jgi:Protein of unknown function (DUF2911)
MKKKIIIGSLVIFVAIALYFVYAASQSRNLSPADKAQFVAGDFQIEVTYGRPFKKDRLIFGTKEEGALVPYKQYWRVGANESTEISFSKPVVFGGQPIDAGKYRLYAVPDEKEWAIILNSELGKWGYFEADASKDILKTTAPSTPMPTSVEQFTISFPPTNSDTVYLTFEWEETRVQLPISPKP